MILQVKKGSTVQFKSQALIVPAFESSKALWPMAADVDSRAGGIIADLISKGDFTGKASQVVVIYTRETLPTQRIALVGLGKAKELTADKVRHAAAEVTKHLRSLGVSSASVIVDPDWLSTAKGDVAAAFAEGAMLGLYRYTAYKTVGLEEYKKFKKLVFLTTSQNHAHIEKQVKRGTVIAQATCYARDLVNAPSNDLTPSRLAKEGQRIAKKRVTCRVLDKGKMRALGMNGLLAVASGSAQEPKFIILEYRGGKKADPPVVLVGKGLTFDTGGISLKPSDKLDEMKMDMAGAATVLGTLRAASELAIPLNVVGLIPATENMPGGSAYKPGDILRTYSGLTVEVINTDAEGRLILADALTYAAKYKPAAVVDIATLTGACVVALGDEVIGMMGTDEALKSRLVSAAKATGERLWELPLWEIYSDMIKSDIADYKNTGGRPAGAITAAAFLSKFAGSHPWAHLDIAGAAWAAKDKGCMTKGATGVGVRLLVELLSDMAGTPHARIA